MEREESLILKAEVGHNSERWMNSFPSKQINREIKVNLEIPKDYHFDWLSIHYFNAAR